jgi:ankyrin repeat protein
VFGQAGTLRTHVRTVDEEGRTPLYHAAKAGDVDEVVDQLELGADVDQADNDGSTPLITTAL